MSRFHGPKVSKTESEKHLNYMAGASYDIKDPIARLRIAASSCFFGEPMYYQKDKDDKRPGRANPSEVYRPRLSDADLEHLRATLNAIDPREWRSMTPAQAIESAIDAALEHDPERTLQEAVRLRQEEHIRTTPQVILVRAAHHQKTKGTGLVRKYGRNILMRADEPSVGLAYHIWRYGKECPIPNSLKKTWADMLRATPPSILAKYKMGERDVKTVDVVNLVHPKGDAIDQLVKGTLSNEDKTWEAIISKEGSNTGTWTKSIDMMGHMALLRNVRNFIQHEVKPEAYLGKLVATAKGGKQLPFRYYSAYNAVKTGGKSPPNVLDAIEECLTQSLGNMPQLKGRTVSLCDNSGSAQGATTSSMGTMKVSSIANLTGVIAGKISDEGYLGVFGDRLDIIPIRKKSSIFDELNKAENSAKTIGMNTENGIWLFLDKAIREKEHWDNIFVFSDMQAGHGGLYGTHPEKYRAYVWKSNPHNIDVAHLINAYRAKVNKDVNVYLVQVAGYQDTILPEFYNKTYILGGWGEGVLRFAVEMSKMELPQQ